MQTLFLCCICRKKLKTAFCCKNKQKLVSEDKIIHITSIKLEFYTHKIQFFHVLYTFWLYFYIYTFKWPLNNAEHCYDTKSGLNLNQTTLFCINSSFCCKYWRHSATTGENDTVHVEIGLCKRHFHDAVRFATGLDSSWKHGSWITAERKRPEQEEASFSPVNDGNSTPQKKTTLLMEEVKKVDVQKLRCYVPRWWTCRLRSGFKDRTRILAVVVLLWTVAASCSIDANAVCDRYQEGRTKHCFSIYLLHENVVISWVLLYNLHKCNNSVKLENDIFNIRCLCCTLWILLCIYGSPEEVNMKISLRSSINTR